MIFLFIETLIFPETLSWDADGSWELYTHHIGDLIKLYYTVKILIFSHYGSHILDRVQSNLNIHSRFLSSYGFLAEHEWAYFLARIGWKREFQKNSKNWAIYIAFSSNFFSFLGNSQIHAKVEISRTLGHFSKFARNFGTIFWKYRKNLT